MDGWWAAVATAVAWAVLVSLWSVLTRKVANAMVVVGFVAAVMLAVYDQRPAWHALGLAATLVPAVGLYASKIVTGGTAKGFGALGAMLGVGAAPAMWVVLVTAIVLEKTRKRAPSSGTIYFACIVAAAVVHASGFLPRSLL